MHVRFHNLATSMAPAAPPSPRHPPTLRPLRRALQSHMLKAGFGVDAPAVDFPHEPMGVESRVG